MDRIYLIILILIVIFSLYHFKYFFNLTIKLKIINIFISFTILSKIISHFILFYSNSLRYIFILKPFISLGLIYIPLISFLAVIILSKKNNLNNKTYAGILSVSILLYLISFRFDYNIILEKGYIYSIRYSNSLFYQIYFYIAVTIFVFGLDCLSKIKNKKLYYFFQLSALLSIADSILYITNISFLPENLLGDLSFIILFNIVLNEIKK
jgi:hypothetical protein